MDSTVAWVRTFLQLALRYDRYDWGFGRRVGLKTLETGGRQRVLRLQSGAVPGSLSFSDIVCGRTYLCIGHERNAF
ncbi:hypothetical protein THAOC_05887 [Thalassiosira oceanica]|uniref:Uncharacterized protein n=1 Tax=Thalassiosira oceanica TaxID=159749 RepID=K0T627_THAOC|nr:hypothetical protein THAOC_05887 [Thalassiosira oceanica]|eukprot:EJK72569.1 hypothetical protein THAOC_05887 [Thalassiosira oceanica]